MMQRKPQPGRDGSSIRILETSADLGLALQAPTLRELFAAAGRGLTELITDRELLERRRSRRFVLRAQDREQLLVNWLNELVARFETEAFLGRDFSVHVRGARLSAQVRGDRFDPSRHPLLTAVKAATYHRVCLEGPKPWRAEVILDV